MSERLSFFESLSANSTGQLLQRSARQPCNLEFIASFSPLSIKSEQLLTTRLGRWLEDKGSLVPCIILIMAVYSVGEVFGLVDPRLGSRIVTVHTDGVQYDLRVVDLGYSIAKVCLLVLGCTLACQRMNRQIFMWCWQSFDAYMLLLAHITCFAARVYNVQNVFCNSGACDSQIQFQLVTDGIFALISGVFTGAMDCLAIDRYNKIALCSLVIAVYLGYYARSRWIDEQYWMKSPVCWWICASPQTIYVSGFAQSLVFLCKTWIAYTRGVPFGILRPEYVIAGQKATLEEVMLNKCAVFWGDLVETCLGRRDHDASASCHAKGSSPSQLSIMEEGNEFERPESSGVFDKTVQPTPPAVGDLSSLTPDIEVARLQAYIAHLEAKLWSMGKVIL